MVVSYQKLWLVPLALALASCNDPRKNGTIVGFNECLNEGRANKLSDTAVRRYCTDKHALAVSPKMTGTAWYAGNLDVSVTPYRQNGTFYWQVRLNNQSTDTIVTGARVTLHRKDKGLSQTIDCTDWAEPGQTLSCGIATDDLVFKPNSAEAAPGDGWSWYYDQVYGIKINI